VEIDSILSDRGGVHPVLQSYKLSLFWESKTPQNVHVSEEERLWRRILGIFWDDILGRYFGMFWNSNLAATFARSYWPNIEKAQNIHEHSTSALFKPSLHFLKGPP
jgi:hypothetical protein